MNVSIKEAELAAQRVGFVLSKYAEIAFDATHPAIADWTTVVNELRRVSQLEAAIEQAQTLVNKWSQETEPCKNECAEDLRKVLRIK